MIPRARLIHTKIWNSTQVLGLKPLERLLYIGLITHGDDYGRLRGDARYLKRQIFPEDKIGTNKVETMREEIRKAALIEVYSVENGVYIQHPNWNRYQTLRKERMKESEYPAPPSDMCQTSELQESAEAKVSEEKEKETKGSQPDTSFSHRNSMKRGLEEARAELSIKKSMDA